MATARARGPAARRELPSAEAVMARSGTENFPVASLLLPRAQRRHLLALYGFARLVDELGDTVEGDRLAALDWLEEELQAAFAGTARHPLMRALSPSIAACALPREPFLRLIEANRMDQRVSRYETWAELEGYCELSANPVGELVLAVFGVATAERMALSAKICTALQLIEHCQDVAEDLGAGRIYLPAEDLRRFGCTEQDLRGSIASAPVRAVVAFEVQRARGLLREGAPLLDTLRGRPRLALAAFIAGGTAAAEAIERAGCDVMSGPPQAGTLRRLTALVATVRERRSAGRGRGR